MLSISEQSNRTGHGVQRETSKLVGNLLACASLLCCLAYWVSFALYYVMGTNKLDLTGFQWFKVMGIAVILAGIATALRSRLWRVALPVALVMFLFVMYVMGT